MFFVKGMRFLAAVFVEKNEQKKCSNFFSRALEYNDFRLVAQAMYARDEKQLEAEKIEAILGEKKFVLVRSMFACCFRLKVDRNLQFKKFFPLACNLPPLLTLNAEFEELLSKICDISTNKSKGTAYGIFEISGEVESATRRMATAKYIGSTCDWTSSVRNESRHRLRIADATRKVCLN